ncbi:hypothetical protein DL96DRAFT_1623115 [Flagelloscypha sp. PMI_526]|nr:hypothetical protein DL96DRAFT_1623115 [Flagelloscypha sp. PMI_526]
MSAVRDAVIDPTVPAHLPLELLEHIISLINDSSTLKAICLTARHFVTPAQSRIFSRLVVTDLREDVTTASQNIKSIASSPHLTQHVRSIVANPRFIELPTLLNSLPRHEDALAQSSGLRELRLVTNTSLWLDDTPRQWTVTLLRSLSDNAFPTLTSLTLEATNAPLSIVTSCMALQNLHVYDSILLLEEDEDFSALFDNPDDIRQQLLPPSPELVPMPFLTALSINGTRNPGGKLCPLITLIQRGKFPATTNPHWFHTSDIVKVVKPFMSQLIGLDMGYWAHWNDLDIIDYRKDLDFFRIQHYPKLHFLSTRLEHARDPLLNALNQGQVPRVLWLAETFESLTSSHPLEVLVIRLSEEWYEEDDTEGADVSNELGDEYDALALRKIWGRLDWALAENPNLEKLGKVVIPIRRQFAAMRLILSFESIDIEAYFQ